jgi:hypothetical protein
VSSFDYRDGDGGDLLRRLAQAEHYLRESLPGGPVVIDPGEPQIRQRLRSHRRQQPAMGVGGRPPTVADFLEKKA